MAKAKISRDVVKLDTRHCIVNVVERLTGPAAWFGIEIDDVTPKRRNDLCGHDFVCYPHLVAM